MSGPVINFPIVSHSHITMFFHVDLTSFRIVRSFNDLVLVLILFCSSDKSA